MRVRQVLNLFLISMFTLFAGISLSLLSPFYPDEALKKGVSVTKSGLVIGSVFLTTIVFTPIFGRYMALLGSRTFLLGGAVLCALGNILFGFMDQVKDTNTFFALSILTRIVTAIGESAMTPCTYAMAGEQVSRKNRGKTVAAIETCFGVGTMFGPTLGGSLYDLGGFGLPFWVSGGVLVLVSLASFMLLEEGKGGEDQVEQESRTVTWPEILRAPGVLVSTFALAFAGSSWSWYAASLEPWLGTKHGLTPGQTGLVFLIFGLTYTVFTPVFGALTDRGLDGLVAIILGNLAIAVGFSLMGPVPPLAPLLGSHLWLTCLSIGIQGLGSASTYLGSLLYMMRGVERAGLPDTEQVRGMVSGLWVVADCAGGYAGSALGSLAFDKVGFESSTLYEAGALFGTVIIICLYSLCFLWLGREKRGDGEQERLIEEGERGSLSE